MFTIIRIPETDSTNDELKRRAEVGAPALTVLTADRQTAGKGRLGRSFFSPDGGLYMSILFRTFADPGLLVTAAAAAVSEAVEALTDRACAIKWVNDVYADGKKICGILAEAAYGADGAFRYAILGIGVNLYARFPADLSRAGALFDAPPPADFRDRLLHAILDRFAAYYCDLPNKPHLSAYRRRMFLPGRDVELLLGGEPRPAHVLGLDDDFRLLVRFPEGERALSSGEVGRVLL